MLSSSLIGISTHFCAITVALIVTFFYIACFITIILKIVESHGFIKNGHSFIKFFPLNNIDLSLTYVIVSIIIICLEIVQMQLLPVLVFRKKCSYVRDFMDFISCLLLCLKKTIIG